MGLFTKKTMVRGFTCGAFDLLHPGHLFLFEKAKEECGWLIIGLHTDPSIDRPSKNKPCESVFERWYRLSAVKYVDEIIPYDTEADLYNLLVLQHPDLRFLGGEYAGKEYTGYTLDIEVSFIARHHDYSSTRLRGKITSIGTDGAYGYSK